MQNNLQPFLDTCSSQPNLYALAKTNTKTKAGKKPTKRKASTKKATKAIAQIQSELLNSNCHAGASVVTNLTSGPSCSNVLNDDTTATVQSSSSISIVQSLTITPIVSQASISIVQSPCINSTPNTAVSQTISVVQSPSINTSGIGQSYVNVVQSPSINTVSGCEVVRTQHTIT